MEVRWSQDHLISAMRLHVLVRWYIYIESAPWNVKIGGYNPGNSSNSTLCYNTSITRNLVPSERHVTSNCPLLRSCFFTLDCVSIRGGHGLQRWYTYIESALWNVKIWGYNPGNSSNSTLCYNTSITRNLVPSERHVTSNCPLQRSCFFHTGLCEHKRRTWVAKACG